MRVLLFATIASLQVAVVAPAATACDQAFQHCRPGVVVFPAYTPEGLRLGSVEARIQRQPFLEVSRSNGQPLTVLYNNPTRIPHAVDPYVYLMALPHVRSSRTRAVYPVGY